MKTEVIPMAMLAAQRIQALNGAGTEIDDWSKAAIAAFGIGVVVGTIKLISWLSKCNKKEDYNFAGEQKVLNPEEFKRRRWNRGE